MQRRTKIVATIGPASQSPDVLRAMLAAGVDVLRINFSHAGPESQQLIQDARAIAKALNRPLGLMADLQGPKIRIGRFKNNSVILAEGQSFTLDCSNLASDGDETRVSVVYPTLCYELAVGDHLLLNDGLIELEVTALSPPQIDCVVIEGGVLSNNKGINRKGGGLAAGALTEKDKLDLAFAVSANVDYISLSFVKDASDILLARQLIADCGKKNIPIIAKIERTEALNHLDEIIMAADGVMVARGDLGVEIGAAEVPAIQKLIIEKSRQLNKIVITATQMMESMITNPQPTRAEVSDVANAILDGTDAVMLSAETASGLYPVKVITMVDKICISAEKHAAFYYKTDQDSSHYQRSDQAIAMAAMQVANHFPVNAIIALTESGATPIWMSRQPSAVPIYAITASEETVSKLTMVNNVYPIFYDYRQLARAAINQKIIAHLLQKGLIEKDRYLLLTRGSLIGHHGGTNRLEIVRS